jgi:hypothetical protein
LSEDFHGFITVDRINCGLLLEVIEIWQVGTLLVVYAGFVV